MKKRVICVASEKGGVGKTVISYALSKDLNIPYITNDLSDNLKNHGKYMKKILKKEGLAIYDLGGFNNVDAENLISEADLLIIPTIPDVNSVMKTILMAKKYKNKTRIIFLANRIKNKKDKEKMKKIHQQFVPWTEFVSLKETLLFKNSYEEGVGVQALYNKNKLNKHVYSGAIKSYKKIYSIVKSELEL